MNRAVFFGFFVLFIGLITFNGITVNAKKSGEDITYTKHAQPIFEKRCAVCHNRMPGTNWMKYSNAYRKRVKILNRVSIKRDMPPVGMPIEESERELIKKWVDGGAKE